MHVPVHRIISIKQIYYKYSTHDAKMSYINNNIMMIQTDLKVGGGQEIL